MPSLNIYTLSKCVDIINKLILKSLDQLVIFFCGNTALPQLYLNEGYVLHVYKTKIIPRIGCRIRLE